jgi:hypothetical protein
MKHGLPGTWQGPTTVIRTRRRHLAHAHCCINTYPQPGDMPEAPSTDMGSIPNIASSAVQRRRAAAAKTLASVKGKIARSGIASKVGRAAKGLSRAAAQRDALAEKLANTGGEQSRGRAIKAFQLVTGTGDARTETVKAAKESAAAIKARMSRRASAPAMGSKLPSFGGSARAARKLTGKLTGAMFAHKPAAKANSVKGDSPPARGRSTSEGSGRSTPKPAAVGGARRGSAPPRRKSIMGGRRRRSSRHHEDDPYPLNALRPGERQWTYEE